MLREYDGHCITSAEDVRELIGWVNALADARDGSDPSGRTDDATRVLDALSVRTPRDLAEIARRSGLGADDAASLLGLLGLEGRVSGDDRGWRRSGK